jgi:hypothetical protein
MYPRWNYESGETKGHVPDYVGSPEPLWHDENVPGASQTYFSIVDRSKEIHGRTYPFNNGDGWKWISVLYDAKCNPITKVHKTIHSSKSYIEKNFKG